MTFLFYLVLFIVAGVCTILLPKGLARTVSKIAAITLAIPLGLAVLAILSFSLFLWFTSPLSLKQLAARFPAQRQVLETLITMSNQDSQFSLIDPDFLYQNGKGTYMANDAHGELPKARWDEYRKLFSHNHIKQGLARDAAGDVFFLYGSEGLLNRGHSNGIVFCSPKAVLQTADQRYEPCFFGTQDGSGKRHQPPRGEAYEFHRLAPNWYAYEQGPS